MFTSQRHAALQRTYALLENDPTIRQFLGETQQSAHLERTPTAALALKLFQAGLQIPPWMVILCSLLSAGVVVFLSSLVLSPFFLPIAFLAGCFLPFSLIESRIASRAAEFSEDYPTILLATASSLKIGMTPSLSLERAVRLLPTRSLVRKEVELLLQKLRKGVTKEKAIAEFGSSIRQPDLALFRAAFLLVSEHGGRFAPTLKRLAAVCRDRAILISSARVSTANMRMTANILLILTPIILTIIASRTDDFWEIFLHHPVANVLASVGIVIISSSYVLLMRMGNFKP